MLTQSRLVYLMIYVSDLERSRSFYEKTLGFGVLEEDSFSVKYDAGHVILCLNKAEPFGVRLPTPRDQSSAVTFLVNDLDRFKEELVSRGVSFTATQRYEIGATTDFFDPDGHWFMLYEPSQTALGWPSGAKITAALAANGSKSPQSEPLNARLEGKELVYFFLFTRDPKAAFEFYQGTLGLRNIEGGVCKGAVSDEIDGVVKYDAGGVLLTTHHVRDNRKLGPGDVKGIAPVFHVADADREFHDLSKRGVRFSSAPAVSDIGTIARFEDPFGRPFYIYQPSRMALGTPSGAKIEQILQAAL